MAAMFLEEAPGSPETAEPVAPVAPEILVPRLGDILLEKKMILPADLKRALVYHKELSDQGRPRLLGQVLLELDLVSKENLDQVITEQILQLQAALQQANLILEQRVQERTLDLQKALEKLSELNQLKSNFISNISHELRTPLTHIKGYLDLMADNSLGPLTPAQSSAVDVMIRSELRLEQLIEDLIRFSFANRGELTLNLAPNSAGELIDSCVSRSKKLAESRHVTLETFIQNDLPAVRADGEKIAWVLIQLIDNATKFSPQGGVVRIAAELEGRFILFSVTDTGIGIPKDRVEEIFEPFHQLDGSETRRYGGTGLGLALVRRIIESHGSFIKVKSEEGRGSRFEFALPKVENGSSR
jgi:signal transduction histidine kinase